MNKRNIVPLILSTTLIGLICIFLILRLKTLRRQGGQVFILDSIL